MRYGFAIDLRSCMGCHTCTISCKQANNLPNEVFWNNVRTDGGDAKDSARGTYPTDLHMVHYPVNCQQCSKPACVEVCPTGASVKREDGLVTIDGDTCIGCGSCITACPYDVRTLLEDEPTYSVGFPVGDWDARPHVAHTVTKCTGCAHRVDRGEIPACMELCPGRARYWGDLDDPNSDVSKFLEGKEFEQLLTDSGTEPNVFYVK
ncbi:4Fe-4S dicluster domain-containing protein [Adlercreutzia sp. R7]|uniref:4Fe-4S dicluster domain-containing protein n=1 Tax=Adlercreutzia wanghongyangiae TaxID=3111451 RepID=A0ABU6IF83_9ACTN|nr:4Fe-4S dicluster domain-containing protein [Adlercreutzia sp. R7]